MKKLGFIFVLTFSLTLFAQERFQKMDSLLTYLYKNDKFMGSLCIREGENVVFNKAYGFADADKEIAADRLTKYKIGSITKTFTAVLIMQLIEEKKLTLQTKLNRFYPKIANADKISIEDLLFQRTGIMDYLNQDSTIVHELYKKNEPQAIIKRIEKYESLFEPNSKHEYSNSNYYILGLIVEKISKKSFAENVENRIVKKANLLNTYYKSELIESSKNECLSYHFNSETWEEIPEINPSLLFSTGGVLSTPADQTRFLHALFDNKLLSKKGVDKMKEIKDGYGAALVKIPFGDRKFYGHNGKIDGYFSTIGYNEAEKTSIAFLMNGVNYNQNDIMIGILSIYYKMPYPFPVFTKIDAAELAKFTGIYASKDLPMKITVSEKNGELIAQATGQSSFPLTYIKEKTFAFATAGIEMMFTENSFVLKQGGMKFNFEKE